MYYSVPQKLTSLLNIKHKMGPAKVRKKLYIYTGTVFHRNIAKPRYNARLKQTLGQFQVELRYCINLCPQYYTFLKVMPGQIRFKSN